MIIKVLGSEISIAVANSVANAHLVRIINTGALGTANIAYSNGVVYANVSVSNTESVVLEKTTTDLLTGANMKAAPVAYRH